jgi:hypothetical protein
VLLKIIPTLIYQLTSRSLVFQDLELLGLKLQTMSTPTTPMAALITPAPRHIIGARDDGPLLGYFIVGSSSEYNVQRPISNSPQLTLHQHKHSLVITATSSLLQAPMVAAMEPIILLQQAH